MKMREVGVDEWIVSVIKAMYEDATTEVKITGRMGRGFHLKVGVHWGSVVSPLLFNFVLEALSRKCVGGLELLYADDLELLADTDELLMEKFINV